MSSNSKLFNAKCSCCPYGVHIGLDFDTYCEALFAPWHAAKRNAVDNSVRDSISQKSKFDSSSSSLPLNDTFHWYCDIQNGSSSELYENEPQLSLNSSSVFRDRFNRDLPNDTSLNDAIAKFEEVLRELQQAWKSKYGVNKNISVNTEIESFHIDSPPVSPVASIDSSVQSTVNKMVLSQIRDQMALSLQKLKQLEDQVRDIPILKQKLILLREEKNRLQRRLEGDIDCEENSFSAAHVKELENRGIITPPLSRRKSLFRSNSYDDEFPDEYLRKEPRIMKAMVSSKNIDLETMNGKKDSYLQTSLTDLGYVTASTNTELSKEFIDVSTYTEISSRKLEKSSTQITIIEPDVCLQSKPTQRSIGITASFAPSLPRKHSSMVTDLRMNDVASLKEINSKKPILISSGTNPLKMKKSEAFIQATVKQKSIGIRTDVKTYRDNSVLCKPETENVKESKYHYKTIQTETITNHDKIAQVSERCVFCELRQTETIGVGDSCPSVADVAIMTEVSSALPPISPKIGSVQNIRLCDKCNEKITSVAKEVVKDKTPSPTLPSKIPRLTHSPVTESSRLNSQKRIIIEETNNEILVYPNPNMPPVGKHRSNFPNMMTAQQQLAGLRLLEEVCKISESESEESNSSDEGTYDLESSTITQAIPKKRFINKKKMCKNCSKQIYFFMFRAEPSKELKAALKVLNDSLLKPERANKSATTKSLQIIEKEWFRISSQKDSMSNVVEDYLDCFETYSKHLLNQVVNLTDSNGNTAMHYAISYSNFDIVSVLLDSKVCDVNKQNKAGYTAIMLVSLAKVSNETQKEVIRRLFQLGDVNIRAKQVIYILIFSCEINFSYQNGQTALMLASSHGQFITCKLLIEAGAAFNVQDNDGSTALMCAAEHGHTDVVRLLLSHPDCDPNISDNDGSTALSIAMEAGHKDIGLMLYASTNMLSRGSSPYASLRRSQSKAVATSLRRAGSFTAKSQTSKSYQLAPSPPPRSRHSSAASTSSQSSKNRR
ncbi:KN motif and ankyrin repeat domain-containing protein 1-like isoform X1 [Dinothrombium tinctorium]|uniref:KN motif and ankyrin repeat domain-containing protein 1-like isoform X1 n=2 Tax=Dinothrombium tinctorium TaxID=1965070 RepID=A0A443RM84_9ACAR|nr:KN motif and ankyrin repeat domain-containing protein 1-like isoform X1 [Dinothrombium tinctorium]